MATTFKKYDKLEVTHDIEKLRQIAEIQSEIQTLDARVHYLVSILDDHSELMDWVWKDANNKFTPIPDLTDEHLENIVKHFKEKSRPVPNNIAKEFLKRFADTKPLELTTNFVEDTELPF